MNASNMKPATPLPWKILQSQDKDGVPRIASKDGGVAVLCINRYMGESGPSKAENQQAAYIVHACNAYPELVAALHEIYTRLLAKAKAGQLTVCERTTREQIRALLAKLGEI